MDWFNKVASKHNDFLNIVRSFPENRGNDNYEDIVQEFYIELSELGKKKHKKGDKRVNPKYVNMPTCKRVLQEDGEVNMVYMWITLKRVSMRLLKEDSKRSEYFVRLGEGFEGTDNEPIEDERAFDKLINLIDEEVNSWHWYDKMMFDTYIKDEKSMRGLSEDTNISLTSVFNTLKNCKDRIRESVSEDYEDYKNQDFELIK